MIIVMSMKKVALILGFLIMGAVAGLAAQTAADHLQAGDELYARFDDAGARAEYERAAALDPGLFAAQWKTARGYLNLGDRVDYGQKDHEQKQQAFYRAGEVFLRKALSLDPRDSYVRFLNAAFLGRLARAMSRERQIAAAYTIKAEIDRALVLDPANDMAWHGLAYWHRTLAEVGGAARFFGGLLFGKIPKGSFEEAVADFRKAIDLNPGFCNHHIELARTYIALKERDMAVAELRTGLACPDMTSQCAHYKERARRMLTRLEKG